MGQVEIIAELSCNHLGSLERALALIDTAAAAGANTVKFQHDPPDGGLTLDSDLPDFTIHGGPWDGRRMADLYRETFTPWEWTDALVARAKERGLEWFSTPGSPEAVAFLDVHGCPRYKVGSFDVTDHQLLHTIAATGKPALVSTGCATPDDIDDVRRILGPRVTFMHCVSQYPTPIEKANLGALGVGWGLSDHSPGDVVPAMAVACGACVIEKHIRLWRSDGGPDAGFSMEPGEFRKMVKMVRLAEKAMESQTDDPPRQFVKSLYVVADIAPGEQFTTANVRAIRPGYGLHPRELHNVLGKRAGRACRRGERLALEMIA